MSDANYTISYYRCYNKLFILVPILLTYDIQNIYLKISCDIGAKVTILLEYACVSIYVSH